VRAVVQRVARAQVTVEGEVVGEIGLGYVVLLGVSREDSPEAADYLADKVVGLRVFEDEAGKMNRAIGEAGGAVLAVSQFTLYGDVRRGRRPGFDRAGRPELAEPLYQRFVDRLREQGLRVETGRFQTHMLVELVNDGPVTILIDSEKTF
jgi:D-tyrosyl-tRNA(Tyr) deacylase